MNQNFHRRPSATRPSTLRVLPVLDLRSGSPVHARGGNRELYRPVESGLQGGADAFGLALAYRDVLGLADLYVADLDAIGGGPPDLGFLRRAAGAGLRVWVDAGVRDASCLDALDAAGADSVIAATETLAGPAQLAEILQCARPGSIVFGLDLREGRPLVAKESSWRSLDPAALIDQALAVGIHRFLILDRARIGSGKGVGTLALVRNLVRSAPGIEVAVGGGITSKAELRELADAGVTVALVGSALHDARIGVSDLRELCGPAPDRLSDR